jgi:two-component sensor histidine kinase
VAWSTQACVDWELPIGTAKDAALVVSELAANAVVHAATSFRVIVELRDEALSVSVSGLRPELPLRPFPRSGKLAVSPDRTPRFGLPVVSAFARAWGVTQQPDAKTVWARLPLPDATTAEAGPPTLPPIHSG